MARGYHSYLRGGSRKFQRGRMEGCYCRIFGYALREQEFYHKKKRDLAPTKKRGGWGGGAPLNLHPHPPPPPPLHPHTHPLRPLNRVCTFLLSRVYWVQNLSILTVYPGWLSGASACLTTFLLHTVHGDSILVLKWISPVLFFRKVACYQVHVIEHHCQYDPPFLLGPLPSFNNFSSDVQLLHSMPITGLKSVCIILHSADLNECLHVKTVKPDVKLKTNQYILMVPL